jgi:hypothetical protein
MSLGALLHVDMYMYMLYVHAGLAIHIQGGTINCGLLFVARRLQAKKLSNDGMDLTLWRRGRKKQCEQNERQVCGFTVKWPVLSGERVNPDVYQEFLRQLVVPWRKLHLLADSAPVPTASYTQLLLAELWTLVD